MDQHRLAAFSLVGLAALLLAIALTACQVSAPGAAAMVNGSPVPRHFYDVLVAASQRRAEQVGLNVRWDTVEGTNRLTQIQTQTIQQLVRNAVIDQLGKQRRVEVDDAELDAAMERIEGVFGGTAGVDQKLTQDGLSRDDFRTLFRYFLLDQQLRRSDPNGYQSALDQAIKTASVEVFVGPCVADHDFNTCVADR